MGGGAGCIDDPHGTRLGGATTGVLSQLRKATTVELIMRFSAARPCSSYTLVPAAEARHRMRCGVGNDEAG
jgi:hypothetical protein